MKITAIKPVLVSEGGRNYSFVKVETDDGIYGLGEAGLGRRITAVAEVWKSFERDLAGADPFRIEHLWQVMFRGGFFPGGVVQTAALSAVDIALWDIKAKALNVPVYELLGGRVRDKVVCYPHVVGADTDSLVAGCRARAEAGWKFVRFSVDDVEGGERLFEPGRAVRRTVEGVRAVREELGEEIEICVDVHTRLDPPDAIHFCRQVEPYRPFFVEDPLRSENAASLRLVRQQTSVPLAVGEQFASKWQFREVLEEDLLDYCRLDLCIVGGLTEGRKVAGWCETHYVALVPHNPLGPVCTAASLHFCLASPLVGVQELSREPGTALNDVFPVQVGFADGHLLVPEGPGLGVEIDDEAAAANPPVGNDGPVWGYSREDGSYTNW